jgi:hypothetical protein
MPSRGAARKPRQRQRQHPTPQKQPANIPAVAHKILADLGAAERSNDPANKPEFFIDLTTVMIALHRWKDDPDASTPPPSVLQRVQNADQRTQTNYLLTAAQLQQRVFTEAVNLLRPQDVPALLNELASSLGYRLRHREGANGDEGAFEFHPVEPEPAAHDIPAIARKILVDLGAPEACQPDHPQYSDFSVNLLEVMRTLHAWRTNAEVLPPAPYVYRIENAPEPNPGYAFSGAQLQQEIFAAAAKLLNPQEVPSLLHQIAALLGQRLVYHEEIPDYAAFEFLPLKPAGDDNSTISPAPARAIESSEPQQHEPPQMAAQQQTIAIANDGTLLKGGHRYHSLYAAAPLAKTTPPTLLNWIKNDKLINGQRLESYYFAPSDTHFISENSIHAAANRFIKWPSGDKAGDVTIGETDDRSGYIGLPAAREILGISNRTMYLWATQRKAPHGQPLDIIKDPISEHLFIREREVYELKKLVPRRGLPLGRRPQPEPASP